MIQLVARKAFTFDGVSHKPGDAFEVAAVVAAALTYDGRAAFAAPSVPKPKKKKGRTYHRRDLEAEG